MADKMLIDATHPEETRVVVLRGNRVEEFDFESANRKQLRGNIYLAKVTRVEPSLQAAFVDYGGNRHGFLAFSEIHPDYYQIPVADRQALIAQEERDQRAADAEAENRAGRRGRHRHRNAGRHRDRDVVQSEPLPAEEQPHQDVEAHAGDDMPSTKMGMGSPLPGEIAEITNGLPQGEPETPEFAAEEHPAELTAAEELPPEANDVTASAEVSDSGAVAEAGDFAAAAENDHQPSLEGAPAD